MSAKKKLFLLHSNNIIVIIQEWSLDEFYPEIYYYYKANMSSEKYNKFYEGRKFVHYKRL